MLPSNRATARAQVMLCCRTGECAESPLAEDCARAVSPILESISQDFSFYSARVCRSMKGEEVLP